MKERKLVLCSGLIKADDDNKQVSWKNGSLYYQIVKSLIQKYLEGKVNSTLGKGLGTEPYRWTINNVYIYCMYVSFYSDCFD